MDPKILEESPSVPLPALVLWGVTGGVDFFRNGPGLFLRATSSPNPVFWKVLPSGVVRAAEGYGSSGCWRRNRGVSEISRNGGMGSKGPRDHRRGEIGVPNAWRIKGKIYALVFFTASLALFVALTLSYLFVYQIQSDLLRAQMRQTLEDKGALLEEWLARRVAVLEMAHSFLGHTNEAVLFSPDLLGRMGFSDLYRGWESGEFQSFSGWVPPADYKPRERLWYRQIRSADALAVSDPYVDAITGQMTISMGLPLEPPDAVSGVLAGDILLPHIQAWLKSLESADLGFLWLLNERGVVLQHPQKDLQFRSLRDIPTMASAERVLFGAPEGEVRYSWHGERRVAIFRHLKPFGWVLGLTLREDQAFENLQRLRHGYLLLFGSLVAFLGLLSFGAARVLGTPLVSIAAFVEEVASGNLEAPLDLSFSREVDALVASLQKMRDKLRENFAVIGAQKKALERSNRELEARVRERTEALERANEELRVSRDALEKLAATDFLTEISNRRDFLQKARREITRSRRFGTGYMVLMADLDGFKEINDRYGHAAGDKVLRRVAGVLRENLREYDLLGRFGGEEFVLLLPEVSREGGKVVAERMREEVGKMEVPWEEGSITVTVSVGAAYCDAGEVEDLEHTLSRADKGLYGAKARGKNQVCPAEFTAHGGEESKGR